MNRLLQGIVCACVCALGCGVSLAQGTDDAAIKARLDQVAGSYTAGDAFMGAVLVVDGDRVLLDKGYGMADLEWGIPNVPDAKFRLGSLTQTIHCGARSPPAAGRQTQNLRSGQHLSSRGAQSLGKGYAGATPRTHLRHPQLH